MKAGLITRNAGLSAIVTNEYVNTVNNPEVLM
jgi:hypothetical protein